VFSLLWIPVVAVLSAGGVVWMVRTYLRERITYRLVDQRRITLFGVLTAAAALGLFACLLLGAPYLAFVLNAPLEVRQVTGQFIVLALDILIAIPLGIALYLRLRLG
jgi:biotin transporter BioY